MQIGKVDDIREDEIAVKPHEGAGIQGQRENPARCGQIEHGLTQHAFVQQCPGQRGKAGQSQFRGDASHRDG